MTLLLSLHALAAVVWVGGMFFAYLVLRPAAGRLEPPHRLALWRGVFARFFSWVWGAILVLLVSGYGMVLGLMGGFAGAGLHVHIMQALGIVMMLLFAHLFFAPWRRFKQAVDSRDFQKAGTQLAVIRKIVAVNLVLGLLVVIIGSGGRYW